MSRNTSICSEKTDAATGISIRCRRYAARNGPAHSCFGGYHPRLQRCYHYVISHHLAVDEPAMLCQRKSRSDNILVARDVNPG